MDLVYSLSINKAFISFYGSLSLLVQFEQSQSSNFRQEPSLSQDRIQCCVRNPIQPTSWPPLESGLRLQKVRGRTLADFVENREASSADIWWFESWFDWELTPPFRNEKKDGKSTKNAAGVIGSIRLRMFPSENVFKTIRVATINWAGLGNLEKEVNF